MVDSSDALILFSKPRCVQCTATAKWLDSRGVSYEYRDVSADADAYDVVVSLGYKQVPVVLHGGEHWSGFDPSKLEAHFA